jgi:prolyl oligopeptidase
MERRSRAALIPSLLALGQSARLTQCFRAFRKGTLHFFETATGRHLPDTIPGVQYPTGGGSAAWNADGSGVFYTRYPRPGERPEADLHFYQQVWFHKLGTPESADAYEIGRDFPRIAEIELEARRSRWWR